VVEFKQMVPTGSERFRGVSFYRRVPNVRSVPLVVSGINSDAVLTGYDLGAALAEVGSRPSMGMKSPSTSTPLP
jgi:hypothetical protein